jgi:hypothetical protein
MWKKFIGAEGDAEVLGRAEWAIPKRGSADMSRSAEPQFAAHVVRLGPVLGWPTPRSDWPKA